VNSLPCRTDLRLEALSGVRQTERVTHFPLPAPLPCRGQLVGLPAGRYDWLRLGLGSPAATVSEETAWLYYRHGLDPERVAVPATAPAEAWVPVPRRDDLLAVRLPDRPDLTLTGLSLVAPGRRDAEVRA
jgi:hypothetical protein